MLDERSDSRSNSVAPANGAAGSVRVSLFNVPKMDCAAEENLIRMALADLPAVQQLQFDLGERKVRVIHSGSHATILDKLSALRLGAQLNESHPLGSASPVEPALAAEARTLRILLAINASMFAIEFVGGWLAQSTGLIADSLDMFADAAVYGLSLYAVGRAAHLKLRAAHLSGWLQLALALFALAEVVRRFFLGSEPEPFTMSAISLLALAANVACLLLIARHRHGGAHMKASWIFSTNDVLANLGVIAAAVLVAWTGTNWPDLAIGAIIATLVLTGAIRILRLR